MLVDWINSFDDSYLVLVSNIPQDLESGVVLSHLVGQVACTQSDREKIFDLLNYPGYEESLRNDQILENFELAYNVLKYSELYQSS